MSSIGLEQVQIGNGMVFSQFKKFIIDNNIVGSTAGVLIALSAKDLLTSIVGDIIIPLIIFLLLKLNIKRLTAILPSGSNSFQFTNFIKNLISWIISMIVTFIFIKTTFELLLGVKKEEPKEDKKEEKKETFFSR
jgi:large conductance mechanosensitive channel protein